MSAENTTPTAASEGLSGYIEHHLTHNTGSVFGGSDPAAETFSTTYTLTGATFTKTSPVFGNITLTITPAGTLTGSATNVPGVGISRVDFSGTITPALITVNYTITFTSTATATGTATFAK